MNRFTWKGIADLVGAGAIVASLVFVGLQLRQAQNVAISERNSSVLSSQIELLALINANAEVWAKGNRGEELDDAEAVIYENLVIARNESAFYDLSSIRLLYSDVWSLEAELADFSGFLFEHPRAREIWNARELRLTKYRELLQPRENVSTSYADAIRANLEKLDEVTR